ncbi:uncharacterized protein EDB93DRAFT_301267 [Suillus bovinus]|uniref:uncharacterized protein n=1 Tax=Suillus bovinus TaxID=48563 RepID=UPI001B866CA6|nr:uncharacterized protein EDB93DRAFT_301267 [Suillus bovinus]KAG2151197.1 hypothetical protein EDB93DRAFT_301267 [Suillus bovinus]
MSLEDFVQQLRQIETSFVAEDEPFVLMHGDFHGRYIVMHGTEVQAVLGREFVSAYPLGELLGGMKADVPEVDDDESDEENALWSREIVRKAEETARQKGCDDLSILLRIRCRGSYPITSSRRSVRWRTDEAGT